MGAFGAFPSILPSSADAPTRCYRSGTSRLHRLRACQLPAMDRPWLVIRVVMHSEVQQAGRDGLIRELTIEVMATMVPVTGRF